MTSLQTRLCREESNYAAKLHTLDNVADGLTQARSGTPLWTLLHVNDRIVDREGLALGHRLTVQSRSMIHGLRIVVPQQP